MMPLTVQTICAAVGGTVLQSSGAAVRDVTTDSRRVPVSYTHLRAHET